MRIYPDQKVLLEFDRNRCVRCGETNLLAFKTTKVNNYCYFVIGSSRRECDVSVPICKLCSAVLGKKAKTLNKVKIAAMLLLLTLAGFSVAYGNFVFAALAVATGIAYLICQFVLQENLLYFDGRIIKSHREKSRRR